MADDWRQYLSNEGDGTMRIKAHGRMKVDARLVTDELHLEKHADDRGPEQLINAASLPGIVGEAWGMADWHFGYGLPIGGVVATDTEHGDYGGAISPGGVGFDINCGVRLIRTNLMEEDVTGDVREQLAQALFDHIPVGVGTKGIIPVTPKELDEVLLLGIDWAMREGYAWPEASATIIILRIWF